MEKIKNSLAVILALFFSISMLTSKIFLFLAILLPIVYIFFLNTKQKFAIMAFATFFPITLMSVADKGILAIEIIAPIACASILLVTIKEKNFIFPREIRLFLIVLFSFLICAAYHFISNPVSAEILGSSSDYNRGLRDYYKIIIGIFVYFSSFWYFAYQDVKKSSWIRGIILVAIILGFIRLASYFFHFEMPSILSAFQYAEDPSTRFGGVTYRIGGIDTVSMLGFSAFVAYYYKKHMDLLGIFCSFVLLVILIVGGGRTAFCGLIFALMAYFYFFNKKYFLPFLCFAAIFMSSYYLLTDLFNLPNQFERLFAISAKSRGMDVGRSETFELYWKIFKENPILGKGIGFLDLNIPNKDFVLQQLKAGGHGAYLSILAIFGIGGGIFLATFLFGSIFMGYQSIKKYYSLMDLIEQERLIIFSLFYLTIISVYYLTGFSGFDDTILFIVAGIVCGFVVKSKRIVKFME